MVATNGSFPECAFMGYNFPFDAGSVNWKNIQLPLPVSRNPEGSARQLTTSEQRALDARRVTYLRNEFGIIYTQGGRTFDGENIDIVRGRDNLVADIKLAQTVLLAAQQGGKLDLR